VWRNILNHKNVTFLHWNGWETPLPPDMFSSIKSISYKGTMF
jgi:hypothetical protein